MEEAPLPAVVDGGRDRAGRFAPGNQFAIGNPHAARVARLRTAALAAVKPRELAAIVRKLVEMALAGDVQAAKLVLDRCLGPPMDILLEERLATLEEVILKGKQ